MQVSGRMICHKMMMSRKKENPKPALAPQRGGKCSATWSETLHEVERNTTRRGVRRDVT